MKRILYLSRGGSMGGGQRQLHYVVTNLDRQLYHPLVVCPKDGQFVTQLCDSGIETFVIPLRPWRKFPAALCRYLDAERLVRFARQHQVALVHSSDLWLNGYMLWVAKRLNIPSILHVRKPVQPKDVRKHRFGKASSIIAISHHIKQDLLRAGICSKKIIQIDDAVDLDLFRPGKSGQNVLREDFSPAGELLVGIVGRVDPSKRQLDFLKIAEQTVRHSNKNLSFFVVGEVHSHSYFEKINQFVNKNGLKRRVHFTGGRNDMSQVLSSLDILVSLSGGSVMFEAMACGKVVVSASFSTKENSVHIQDGHTGILVDSREDLELVKALTQVVNAPELRMRLGQQARNWAQNHLSHTKMTARTQQLYNQLLQD